MGCCGWGWGLWRYHLSGASQCQRGTLPDHHQGGWVPIRVEGPIRSYAWGWGQAPALLPVSPFSALPGGDSSPAVKQDGTSTQEALTSPGSVTLCC